MQKRFYKSCVILSASVLLCGFVIVGMLRAQSQRRIIFREDATMVNSDVTVVGRDTSDLKVSDFVIYDNGVAHEVSYFSRNTMPLAIAFLIDSSLTVQPYLPYIQVAAGAALRSLDPEDLVVLYSFAQYPQRRSKLISDRVEIAKKISKLEFTWGTNIYETISDAAKYLQKNAPNHRRAIIMISDNYHLVEMPANQEKEQEKAEDALARALEGAVTIFSIKTPSITNVDASGSLPRVRRIVTDTGGEVHGLRGWTSLQSAMEEILSKLRKQYTIGFNPTDLGEDGSFHKLEIKFADEKHCPECRILARTGYYTGVSSPTPAKEDKKKKKPKYSPEEMDQLIIQQSIATAGTYTYTTNMFFKTVEDIVTNMSNSLLSDISLGVNASRDKNSRGKDIIKIDLQIATDRIKFREVKDRHGCKLHIGVFYFDNKMRLIGSDVKILEGLLKEDTYKQAMESGILYPIEIPSKVGKQYMSVVVYDEYSDRVGSTFIKPLPES